MAKVDVKDEKNKVTRPPIVTLMGHVDHGKTSILDAIRNSDITKGESGGITQHTGAYTVKKDDKKIVFIDTPGHEAFSAMRSRGGKAADIVILVVAADDGVMPQTKEAIQHAKSSNSSIIVAINKVDLESADVQKVKRELSQNDLLVEGMGGDIPTVEVSAIKGTGIDKLIDLIFLVREMEETKFEAEKEGNLEALVIESEHSSKKGVTTSIIIKNGTLKVRDEIATKSQGKVIKARVKAMKDSENNQLKEASIGDVVDLLGFNEPPLAGDIITNEDNIDNIESKTETHLTQTNEVDSKKSLNVIVKADTIGTLEAIISSLSKLEVDETKVNILGSGVGDVNDSDILLASTTNRCIIVAFKVKVSKAIEKRAEEAKVIIRTYSIIYKLIEEIEGALEGVVEIEERKIKGRGYVIQVFTLPKSQMKIAGTLVEAGSFKVNDRVGVYRDDSNTPIHISRIKSLKEKKDDVEKTTKGTEVGILFKVPFDDIQVEDKIEVL